MNVFAVMPVSGREPLLKLTVSRLVRQGVKVVCAGHTDTERDICTGAGAWFILTPRSMKLGAKWQACVDYAKDHHPDAVMVMGSSDMVQDGWAETLLKDIEEQDCAMAGTEGVYFLDIQPGNSKRMIRWGGYTNSRRGEPIGTGRLVGRKALDRINWQLFDKTRDKGMDESMMLALKPVAHKFNKLIHNHPGLNCLSISTYRWTNLHSFEGELLSPSSKVVDPKQVIDRYFPEMDNLFNDGVYRRESVVPYTVNVGGYDKPRNDILCFSDYDRFVNPERNSRIYFILPHLFIDCEVSILVGCDVQVKVPYQQLVDEWLGDADMALFKHPWRDCVHEEIIAAEGRMKRPKELEILRGQGQHYRDIGVPEHLGLPETAITIRRHNRRVINFCNAWWAEMCRWSYRDQCSFSKVLLDFPELKVNYIEPDVRVHPYTSIGSHANESVPGVYQ